MMFRGILILALLLAAPLAHAGPVIKSGSTSQLVEVFVPDSSSATGAGLTGLVYNSAGLTAYYYCAGAAATAITLAAMTAGTWATGGFVEVDATNMPGVYQFGIPDAALASGCGADTTFLLKGAANMVPARFAVWLPANVESDTYTVATGTGVVVAAASLTAIADAVCGAVAEAQNTPNVTLCEAASLLLSYAAGATTVVGSSATYKTPDGTQTRVTGTFSGGERSAITITPSP